MTAIGHALQWIWSVCICLIAAYLLAWFAIGMIIHIANEFATINEPCATYELYCYDYRDE